MVERMERVPFELGRARGFRYGELPAGIEARLGEWLRLGRVPEGDGEVLKPDTVWRVGSWAVKVYPRRGGLEGWFRHSPAVRAMELARVLPVRTPRPLLALELRSGGRRPQPEQPDQPGQPDPSDPHDQPGRADPPRHPGQPVSGLSVSEFVEGRWLHRLWDDDPPAREAFPRFLVDMHTRGVFHGDLNLRNMLWDGTEWVLLDLEGVRRGLRARLPRRLIEAQWVRVLATLRGRPGSRELFEAYLKQAPEGGPWSEDPAAVWERIEARARRTVARWDAARGGPPKDLPATARWR